jgi:hypothetical protein
MSSFLSSFANILLHLDQIDSLYIDHLARVIGAIFSYFPTLWPKQRIAHYFAISRLFTALYSKQSALQTLLSRVGMYREPEPERERERVRESARECETLRE